MAIRREKGFYRQLNNSSTADFHKPSSAGRSARLKDRSVFAADRLLSARLSQSSGREYLVKWKGYPFFDSSWEIEGNVSQDLVDSFFLPPCPDQEAMQSAAEGVCEAVLVSLRSHAAISKFHVPMPHPVFHHLFHRLPNYDHVKEFEVDPTFLPKHFPQDRLQLLDCHGQGRAVESLRLQHLVREKKAGHSWREGKAVKQTPFFIEQLVVTLKKKVVSMV